MLVPKVNRRPSVPLPATKVVLYLLSTSGQALVEYFTFFSDLKYWGSAYRRGGRAYVGELKRLRDERYARTMLHRLTKAEYLVARKLGQRVIVELTNKGRAAILRERLRRAPELTHRYTVVIFDIPESQRLARNLFRRVLKEGGFTMLQQSVWLSERDVRGIVVDFIGQFKLDPWVNVYYATDFYHLPKH